MENGRARVKDHIAGTCNFVRARAGNLWYRTALGLEFPVPFADMAEATFDAEVKGITLMRYIRMHIEARESARQTQATE